MVVMKTTKGKKTTDAGVHGEILVEGLMTKLGLTFNKQRQVRGRGHKWVPDFTVTRANGDKEFVEVKTQWSSGTADEKVITQIVRAYRMDLTGVFVLLPMGTRQSFRPEVIQDIRWLLENTEVGHRVKLAVGLEEAEVLLGAMKW